MKVKWKHISILNSKWAIVLFVALAVFIRCVTFFPTTIDHDESTYLVMAQLLLKGKVLYVDMVDIKPPGIFLIYAFFLKILGSSVFFIRLMAAVVIGITGYLVGKIYQKVLDKPEGGPLAGILFLICASIHKWTWSGNTEIYMVAFAVLGLYLLLQAKKTWHYFLFGIIMGFGFMVRYQILFDFSIFSLFFLFWKPLTWKKTGAFILLSGIGFFLPFLTAHIWYYLSGNWDAFYQVTYLLPRNYISDHALVPMLAFIGDFYVAYAPLTIIMVLGLFQISWQRVPKSLLILLIGWTLTAWLGSLITGKLHYHYRFQVIPSFSLLMAWLVFYCDRSMFQKIRRFISRNGTLLVFLAALAVMINQFLYTNRITDFSREIAAEISPSLGERDLFYTNYQNILHFLCDSDPPSRYVHSTVLYRPTLFRTYAVHPEVELQQIFKQEPKFAILRKEFMDELEPYIQNNYILERTYEESVFLYRRK